MIQEEIKSKISQSLFWDVDFKQIDFINQKKYIIPRVMDRGTKKDVRLIWDFYGEKTIRETLINARFLEEKTICFFANFFSIHPSDFRSFQIKKTISQNWNQ